LNELTDGQAITATIIVQKSLKKRFAAIHKAIDQYCNEQLEKIDEFVDHLVNNLIEESSRNSSLYKACHGNKKHQAKLLKRMIPSSKSKTKEDLAATLKSRGPSSKDMFSKMMKRKLGPKAGDYASDVEGDVKKVDKYAGLSDSERRTAEKKDMIADMEKHRQKLLAKAKSVPDTLETRPDKMRLVKSELIEKIIKSGTAHSYNDAAKRADAAINEELAKRKSKQETRVPTVEEIFNKMKKKKKHWLDGK